MNISETLAFPALSALWRGTLNGIVVLWECACQMPWLIVFLVLSILIKRLRRR